MIIIPALLTEALQSKDFLLHDIFTDIFTWKNITEQSKGLSKNAISK
jgi:hypothetical protein